MAAPTDTRTGIAHAEVDATVTRTAGRKRTIEAEGHEAPAIKVPVPSTPVHAEVEVAVGSTIGLPGFSAARFDVRLRLPCKTDPESVERTYNAALGFCQKKLDALKATVE